LQVSSGCGIPRIPETFPVKSKLCERRQ
jgi:hypothetical protein